MKHLLLISLLSFSLFVSCYEPQEACLDVLSVNFNIQADDPCEDCCKYPNIYVESNQIYGDSSFVQSKTYENKHGQSFQLEEAWILLHDFKLHTNKDSKIEVRETTDFGSQSEIKDDFMLHQLRDISTIVGTVGDTASIQSIEFTIGTTLLGKPINTDHQLYKIDSLYQVQNKYPDIAVFGKWGEQLEHTFRGIIQVDHSNKVIRKDGLNNTKTPRQNYKITIDIDYKVLMNDIQFDQSKKDVFINNWKQTAAFINIRP